MLNNFFLSLLLSYQILSKLILITVISHVSAVFWYWFVMWEPLIYGTFHGLKPGFAMGYSDSFSELVLLQRFILFSVCIGGTYGILRMHRGW